MCMPVLLFPLTKGTSYVPGLLCRLCQPIIHDNLVILLLKGFKAIQGSKVISFTQRQAVCLGVYRLGNNVLKVLLDYGVAGDSLALSGGCHESVLTSTLDKTKVKWYF